MRTSTGVYGLRLTSASLGVSGNRGFRAAQERQAEGRQTAGERLPPPRRAPPVPGPPPLAIAQHPLGTICVPLALTNAQHSPAVRLAHSGSGAARLARLHGLIFWG